jgi:DNA-binding beta-propeller fold protein YncE
VLKKLTIQTRTMQTIAGFPGNTGSVDGIGRNALFVNPVVSAYIPAQKVNKALLTDQLNHVVRRVDLQSGSVTTLAGQKGVAGTSDGSGTNARFNQPFGLVVSSAGEIAYVAEYSGHSVRSIQIKTGVVTTGAGVSGMNGSSDGIGVDARFFHPCGLALAQDNSYLYWADSSNHLIRRINVYTWEIMTFAGSAGYQGSADGVGTTASFSFPQDVSVFSQADASYLYVADRNNNKLRRIDITTRSTVTLKTTPDLSRPSFISLTSDGLYALVSEASASSIKQVSLDSGLVTVLTGVIDGAALATSSILESLAGITLMPQEPRRVTQITGTAIEYIQSLKIRYRDGDSLDYI